MEKHISEEVVHLGTDGARLGRCNTDLARFSGRKIKTSLLACSISYYVRLKFSDPFQFEKKIISIVGYMCTMQRKQLQL